MTTRYICRLLITRGSSGNVRIEYGPLDNLSARVLMVEGPRVLVPPSDELTDDEFQGWQRALLNDQGFSILHGKTPIDAPLVEAKRLCGEVIPPGTVRVELFWPTVESRDRTLGVRIQNSWDRDIPDFSLALAGPDETLVALINRRGQVSECLPPGVGSEYFLTPDMIDQLRGKPTSFGTCRIVLRTETLEIDCIGGEVLAGFLKELLA